ncbi:MAG: 2-nitropropane dioxygenase [Methylibium sp.]|nr:2-nitropropane dioxygenase [Methylibium sp.]
MTSWPDTRLCDLLGITLPLIQAPMAGPNDHALAVAAASAGALGSLPCAMLSSEQIRAEVARFRELALSRPLNLNFFCHRSPAPDATRDAAWRAALKPFYLELGLDPDMPLPAATRRPFDAESCALVEQLRPEVLSFHFGLPEPALLARVKATGARVLSSATTVDEARWLAGQGCDAIIAQGVEAGGHRGVFLGDDISTQPGTFALLPQIVDAVELPVIAAGGIADGRGMAAALTLGAAGVQIGTAYLLAPECKTPAVHRAALQSAAAEHTSLTNLFSGRPARGIVNRLMRELGPLSVLAPAFPQASAALAPLRAAAEARGSADFTPLWAGQAASLARAQPAAEITRRIAAEALRCLGQ